MNKSTLALALILLLLLLSMTSHAESYFDEACQSKELPKCGTARLTTEEAPFNGKEEKESNQARACMDIRRDPNGQ